MQVKATLSRKCRRDVYFGHQTLRIDEDMKALTLRRGREIITYSVDEFLATKLKMPKRTEDGYTLKLYYDQRKSKNGQDVKLILHCSPADASKMQNFIQTFNEVVKKERARRAGISNSTAVSSKKKSECTPTNGQNKSITPFNNFQIKSVHEQTLERLETVKQLVEEKKKRGDTVRTPAHATYDALLDTYIKILKHDI